MHMSGRVKMFASSAHEPASSQHLLPSFQVVSPSPYEAPYHPKQGAESLPDNRLQPANCWCGLLIENAQSLLALVFLLTDEGEFACLSVLSAFDQLRTNDGILNSREHRLRKMRTAVIVQALFLLDTFDSQPLAGKELNVARVIRMLPPDCRAVFVLRIYEKLDHASTASLLGLSQDLVQDRLVASFRALTAGLNPA